MSVFPVHRRTRMGGRDPHEPHRAATPLELLFDLTFVVAFGIAGSRGTVGDREAVAVGQQSLGDHAVPQRHAEPAGQVVVAGAGLCQAACADAGPQALRLVEAAVVDQPLDELGDVRSGQAEVAVAALPEGTDEAGVGQGADVLTGRGRRDAGDLGQLGHGPRPPVDQCQAHGGPAVVGQDGGDLMIWGSANLVTSLLAAGQVDELNLMIEPILLGGGKRIFPEDGMARPMQLVSSTTAGTGVQVCTYRPAS